MCVGVKFSLVPGKHLTMLEVKRNTISFAKFMKSKYGEEIPVPDKMRLTYFTLTPPTECNDEAWLECMEPLCACCERWRKEPLIWSSPRLAKERVNLVPFSLHCAQKWKSVLRLWRPNWLKPQPTERDWLPEPLRDRHLRKPQWTVLSQTHSLITQHSKCLARNAEWPSLGRNPRFRWRKVVKRNQYWD